MGRSFARAGARVFGVLALLSAALVGGPAGSGTAGAATRTAQPAAQQVLTQPCGNPGVPGAVHHVIWIWMENESFSTVLGNTQGAPYQNQLASQCGVPTNMYNESHASLINYISATNGQTITTNSQFITHNDCVANATFCNSGTPSIFSQIDATPGESWRGYAEDMPSNCSRTDSGNYAVRHNPATYYTTLTTCAQFDVPMGSVSTQSGAFYSDVQAGTLPSFSFITPNLIDDAHSSSTAAGDSWLSKIIPIITGGANYQSGDTTIFITNDEGGSGTSDHVIGEDCANQALAASQPSCHIPTIVVSPYTPSGTQSSTFFTHYSMLRTTEELLGLPLLGQAATANSMAAAFNLGPAGNTPPPTTLQPVTGLTASATSSTQITLTWTAGALATGYTITRNGAPLATTSATTFTDSGLSPNTTYTYAVTATDAAGDVVAPTTVSGTTLPVVQQWVTNQSVEANLTGWSGVYNSTSVNTRVAGGYDGGFSLRTVNKTSAVGTNGFIDKPHWIAGTPGDATVAGTTYTGSVWLKADAAGQKLTLFLRELNPAGAGVNKAPFNVGVTVTATSTNWFQITEAYPALATGDSLGFYVYGTNVGAGQGFNADLMSLTSPSAGITDSVAPTPPTNVTAVPISQTQMTVKWGAATDNVGVTGYRVTRNGVQIASTAATTITDGGLSPATPYTYSVTAVDAAGNVSSPASATATTPPILGAPTGLSDSIPNSSEIDLTWTAATGATGYTVTRNGTAIGVATIPSYADTGLTAGITYTYTVVATDSFGGSVSSTSLPVTIPTGGQPPPPPPQPLALCGNPAPASPIAISHVIVVMLENNSYKQVVGSANASYQTALSSQCGNATAMFATTHASAANYLALSAGEFPSASPAGCGTVKGCADASDNLYHQLDLAGLSWRSYQESMPKACSPTTSGNYKIGHNAAIFYSDLTAAECQSNDIGVSDLRAQAGPFWTDLTNQTLPSLSIVTPNLADDGEGPGGPAAGLQAADSWLKSFLATVVQSNSYQAANTAIFITYDEGSGSDSKTGEDCTNEALDLPITNATSAHQDSCHVPLFVVYPFTPTGSSDATFFDHYSITKTVEDLFGLAYLAHAGDAQTSSLLGHFGLS